MHSSRVILINNDVRLEDQEWGIEHAPSVDINSIDKISVIKGASALQYAGDAVGGVIIMETSREKLIDDLYGGVTTNLQSNGRGGEQFPPTLRRQTVMDGIISFRGLLKKWVILKLLIT